MGRPLRRSAPAPAAALRAQKWAIRAASFTGSPFASSKPVPGLCESSQALLCISCVSGQTLLWVVPYKMARTRMAAACSTSPAAQ